MPTGESIRKGIQESSEQFLGPKAPDPGHLFPTNPLYKDLIPEGYQGPSADIPDFDISKIDFSFVSPATEEVQLGATGFGKSQYDIWNLTPYTVDEINAKRAEYQGGLDNFGNFVMNTIFGGVIGTGVAGVGALGQIPELIYDKLKGQEHEFKNAFIDFGTFLRTRHQEIFPQYREQPNIVMDPNDPAWWASGAASAIGSALAFLIPGLGVIKVGAWLGKLAGIAQKMGPAASYFAKIGSLAGSTRHMENYIESNEVYTMEFNKAKERGLDDLKASQIAGEAAALTYKIDWSNIGFDIIQSMAIIRPFNVTRNLIGVAKKVATAETAAFGTATTALTKWERIFNGLKTAAKAGIEPATESIEEGVNYIAQQEGIHRGDMLLGLDDGSDFSQRASAYLKSSELYNNMFWGAIGGGLFSTVGGLMNYSEEKNRIQTKIEEIGSRATLLKGMTDTIKAQAKAGAKDSHDDTISRMTFEMGLRASAAGNIDLVEQMFDGEDIKQMLVDAGMTEEEVNKFKEDRKKEILEVEELYNKNFNQLKFYESEYKGQLINSQTGLEFFVRRNVKEAARYEAAINNIKSKPEYVPVPFQGNTGERMELIEDLAALGQYKALLQLAEAQLKSTQKPDKSVLDAIAKDIAHADIRLEELEAAFKNAAKTFAESDLSKIDKDIQNSLLESPDPEIIGLKRKKLFAERLALSGREKLAELRTNAGRKKLEDTAAKDAKTKQNALLNDIKAIAADELTTLEDLNVLKKKHAGNAAALALIDSLIADKKASKKSAITHVDKSNIASSLKKRWKEDPEIYNIERDELDQLLAGIGPSPIGAITTEEFPGWIEKTVNEKDSEGKPTAVAEIVKKWLSDVVKLEVKVDTIQHVADSGKSTITPDAGKPSPATKSAEESAAYEQSKNHIFVSTLLQFEGSWQPTKDGHYIFVEKRDPKTGQLIPTSNPHNIDFHFLNSGKVSQGTEIRYEVDPNNPFVQGEFDNPDNFAILMVVYDAAGRHVIGVLPTAHTAESRAKRAGTEIARKQAEALKALRNEIYNDTLAHGATRSKVFSTKSLGQTSGIIHNVPVWQSPSSVLAPGEDLIFGVGIEERGTIRLKTGEDRYYELVAHAKSLSSGAVYMLVQSAAKDKAGNPVIIPAAVKTRNITEEEADFIIDQLSKVTKNNWKGSSKLISEIVLEGRRTEGFSLFRLTNNALMLHNQLTGKPGKIPLSELSNLSDARKAIIKAFLMSRPHQINVKMLNGSKISDHKAVQDFYSAKGYQTYNELLDKEVITTDLNPITHTHTSTVIVEQPPQAKPVVQQSEKDILTSIFGPLPPELLIFNVTGEEEEFPSEDSLTDIADTQQNEDRDEPSLKPGKPGKPAFKLRVYGNHEKWDKSKALAWFRKTLPNVDIAVLSSLFEVWKKEGIDAWGMFWNAAAWIHTEAPSAVVYHEAFHAVFRLYLTNSEQKQILSEAAKRYGKGTKEELDELADSLKLKEGEYSEEDLQILWLEEKLADDFMLYKTAEQADREGFLTKQGFGAAIKKFFRNLYQLIKSIFTDKVSIDELFFRMSEGHYKHRTKIERGDKFKDKVARLTIKGFHPIEQKLRTDTINAMLMDIVEQKRIKLERATGFPKDKIDVFQNWNIDSIYSEVKTYIAKLSQEDITPEQRAGFQKIIMNFESLREVAKRDLKYRGLIIKKSRVTDDTNTAAKPQEVDNSLQQVDEEYRPKNETWQMTFFQRSTMEAAPQRVLDLFQDIPVIEEPSTSQQFFGAYTPILDDLGFPISEDSSRMFAYVQRAVAGLTSYEEIIQELSDRSEFQPFLNVLLDRLNESSLQTQSAFVSVMAKSHHKFIMIRKYVEETYIEELETTERKVKVRVFDSNRQGIVRNIINQWAINLLNTSSNQISSIIDGKPVIDRAKANKLLEEFETILNKIDPESAALSLKEAEPISKILEKAGIAMSSAALVSAFKSRTVYSGKIVPAYQNFISQMSGQSSVKTVLSALSAGESPYDTETKSGEMTSLRKLARLESNVQLDLYLESFRNVENKSMFSINLTNFVSRHTNKIKSTNFGPFLKSYLNTVFYKNSPWLNDLAASQELRDNFDYFYLDGAKIFENRPGIRYDRLSPFQLDFIKLNAFLNQGNKFSYYAFPVLSDSTNMLFTRFKRYENESIVDKIYNIAEQEMARMLLAAEEVKTLEPDKLVEHYHYKSSSNKIAKDGNAFRFIELPFLNKLSKEQREDENLIREEIRNYLELDKINLTNRLLELGILERDSKGNFYSKEISIEDVVKEFSSFDAFLTSYAGNSFIANSQITQIYAGDQAYYKSDKSGSVAPYLTQRLKEITAPSMTLDTRPEAAGETYVSTTIDDIVTPIVHIDLLKKILTDAGMTAADAEKEVAEYSNVKETDGQGYITLDRWKKELLGLGRFGDAEEKAYEDLKAGRNFDKALKIVVDAIKPVYFGHKLLNGRITPIYNKYAKIVLLPQLVKGNKFFEDLLDVMEKKGIDEVIFKSASKVGTTQVLVLNTDRSNLNDLQGITLFNEDYGWQQETPNHHLDEENIYGTQYRKLLLSNLSDAEKIKIDNTELTGRQIKDTYHAIQVANIEENYTEVATQLSTKEGIKTLLLEEIDRRKNLNEHYEDILQIMADGDFYLPLSFPTVARKYEEVLYSIFKRKVRNQKIKGMLATQAAGPGFDLKFMISKDGKVIHAECLLPWWTKEVLPANPESLTDQSLLELVGYRIPTENKRSMILLKPKGFLPEALGSIIIVPTGLTVQNSSDMDADKEFIIIPEFEVKETPGGKEVGRIKYDWTKAAAEQPKTARNNGLLAIANGVLQHKSSHIELLKHGGFSDLIAISDEILIAKGAAKEPLVFNSSVAQSIQFERAGAGNLIPAYALHNSNHPIAQEAGFWFSDLADSASFDGKITRSLSRVLALDEKTTISDNVSRFLAMAVDTIKSPIAWILNANQYTSDVIMLLIRLGYSPRTVSGFLAQPVLMEFVSSYFNYGGTKAAELRAYDETLKTYTALAGRSPKKGIVNFNTDRLYGLLKESSSEVKSKDYYKDQLDTLAAFHRYKGMANELIDVTLALRGDAKGPGPQTADSIILIDGLKRIIEKGRISGIAEIFPKLALEIDSERFIDLKDKKSTYPFLETMMTRIHIDSVALLQRYFPWNTPAFKGVQNSLAHVTGRNSLSVAESVQINYELLSYLFSSNSLYNDLARDDAAVIYGSKRQSLFYGKTALANRLVELKAKYPEFAKLPFIQRLSPVISEIKDKSSYIDFNNSISATGQNESVYSANWWYLLNESANEETKQFAKDLIVYSFMDSGFRRTLNSLSHLLPLQYFYKTGFREFYKSLQINLNNILLSKPFVEQYLRNFPDSSLLIKATNRDITQFKLSGNTLVAIKVDPDITLHSPLFKEERSGKDTLITPVRYFSYNVNKQTSLMRLSHTDEEGAFIYHAIPLQGNERQSEYYFGEWNPQTALKENHIKIGKKALASGDTGKMSELFPKLYFGAAPVESDVSIEDRPTAEREAPVITESEEDEYSDLSIEEAEATGFTAEPIVSSATEKVVISKHEIAQKIEVSTLTKSEKQKLYNELNSAVSDEDLGKLLKKLCK